MARLPMAEARPPQIQLAHHFRGKPPEIRSLFDDVVAAIRTNGPVRILPEKTRIAFQVRMSFAQITPRRRWLDGHLVLARRIDHPRFRSVQTFSPRNHLHTFRLAQPSEIDADFRAWLTEAYLVGDQQHLKAGIGKGTEDRGQKTGDRNQNWRQRTRDKGQSTTGKGQDRRQKTEGAIYRIEHR